MVFLFLFFVLLLLLLLLQLFELGGYLSLGRAMQKCGTPLTDIVFTFNLRSSCMAKEDLYFVLVKRIRKQSFRPWVHGAEYRHLTYKWISYFFFQELK